MYYIGLDVRKKPSDWTPSRRERKEHDCAMMSVLQRGGSHGPRSSLVFFKPVKKPGSECSGRVSDDVCKDRSDLD